MVKAVVNAPFTKSLRILSLFSKRGGGVLGIDNPSIGKDAGTFVSVLTNAIKEHRFENMRMLYLGRARG